MASMAANMIGKHILKENAKNRFGKEVRSLSTTYFYFYYANIPQDPYFETVQATDANGRPYGKARKQKKPVPEGISAHDAKVLTKVKRRAYRLDNAINICGIKFGWSSIIGIIPAAGDFVDFFMAWMVINSAKKVEGGLDKSVESKMWLNVIIDFAIGLVPFLGDFADAFFRANTRNAVELERMLIRRRDKGLAAAEKAHQQSRPNHPHDQQYLGTNHDTDLPPRYEAAYHRNEEMRTEPAKPKPARTATGGSRGWFGGLGGRGEPERDVERGEGIAPVPPPRPRV